VDELTYIVLSALVNGAVMAVALYVGMRKGIEKTVDTVVERLRERLGGSPTAKRLERLLESAERLLGDERLAEQATRFFKEAADLASSREARDFFRSLAELLKAMTAKPPVKEVVKLGEEVRPQPKE
jgi:hypothetical protein